MKKWRDARKGPEQRALLAWAVASGSLTEAAKVLGITRRYLSQMVNETRRAEAGAAENSVKPEKRENGESSENRVLTEGQHGRHAPENRTQIESLTYGDTAPSLEDVLSPSAEDAEQVNLNLTKIPKPIKNWIEAEALRRKQAGRTRHTNMTLVIVDAVKALQARTEGEDGGGGESE